MSVVEPNIEEAVLKTIEDACKSEPKLQLTQPFVNATIPDESSTDIYYVEDSKQI